MALIAERDERAQPLENPRAAKKPVKAQAPRAAESEDRRASAGRSFSECLLRFTLREVGRDAIWWLPLRLFVAVGWLRAFAEKAVNPAWLDGSSLAEFLSSHLPKAVFPGYALLMHNVFLPNAALFAWLVMIAQVCVGLALLFGWRTK